MLPAFRVVAVSLFWVVLVVDWRESTLWKNLICCELLTSVLVTSVALLIFKLPPASICRVLSAFKLAAVMLVSPPEERAILPPLKELNPELVVVVELVVCVDLPLVLDEELVVVVCLVAMFKSPPAAIWRVSAALMLLPSRLMFLPAAMEVMLVSILLSLRLMLLPAEI